MARNTECRCTVPLQEFGPSWASNADRDAWAKVNGVTIIEDYLGRPALSIDDAYRMGEKNKQAQAEAERQYAIRLEVANANRERQRIYDAAMKEELRAMHGSQLPPGARTRALKAVAAYDKGLSREVRSHLDAINITMTEMSFGR